MKLAIDRENGCYIDDANPGDGSFTVFVREQGTKEWTEKIGVMADTHQQAAEIAQAAMDRDYDRGIESSRPRQTGPVGC